MYYSRIIKSLYLSCTNLLIVDMCGLRSGLPNLMSEITHQKGGTCNWGLFWKPPQQTGLVYQIWVGPHMVTNSLVKSFIWQSQLQVGARLLNAGVGERLSRNGISFSVNWNVFLLFQQRESDIWQCWLGWRAENSPLVFKIKWYFNDRIHVLWLCSDNILRI